MTSEEVVRAHEAAGRAFAAAGVRSFVREQGEGDPVVCIHGVPSSSFLYRKVLGELADRGLRGVAFDLPGLGLAERPQEFDYSWTGLGRFCVQAVAALELDRFHLVLHDIGGPIGIELIAALPDRVRSLTMLNAVPPQVVGFKRPWSMQPFAMRGIGPAWLAGLAKPAFRRLMLLQGIKDAGAVSKGELDAYVDLLKRGDGGHAFLRIMRGFERTAAKQQLYLETIRGFENPRQVVWGDADPALPLELRGEQVREALGVERIHPVPAKHFLQEDQAPAVAERVAALASDAP